MVWDYRLRGNDVGEHERLSCKGRKLNWNMAWDYRLRGNNVREHVRLSCGGRKLNWNMVWDYRLRGNDMGEHERFSCGGRKLIGILLNFTFTNYTEWHFLGSKANKQKSIFY